MVQSGINVEWSTLDAFYIRVVTISRRFSLLIAIVNNISIFRPHLSLLDDYLISLNLLTNFTLVLYFCLPYSDLVFQ